jgi:plasmid maintenance system antidote protein VapI
MLHIGKLIEEELRSQGRTPTWIAKQLHCDRSNVYKIFGRKSLDTALLLRISVALERDFFKLYTDCYAGHFEEEGVEDTVAV